MKERDPKKLMVTVEKASGVYAKLLTETPPSRTVTLLDLHGALLDEAAQSNKECCVLTRARVLADAVKVLEELDTDEDGLVSADFAAQRILALSSA